MNLAQISRLYQVELVDYGEHRGGGLLVCVGCGLMMGIMDASPPLRWCVDTATLRDKPGARLTDFMIAASRVVEPFAFAGWFSITNPKEIRDALASIPGAIVYTGKTPIGLPGELADMRQFLARFTEVPGMGGGGDLE